MILVIRLTQPIPTLFPYTTLFRSGPFYDLQLVYCQDVAIDRLTIRRITGTGSGITGTGTSIAVDSSKRVRISSCDGGDRKSTRLNSSHMSISYAVFCLKKKNTSWHLFRHARQIDNQSIYKTPDDYDNTEGLNPTKPAYRLVRWTAVCATRLPPRTAGSW